MKKLLLILCLVFIFAGCGTKNNEQRTENNMEIKSEVVEEVKKQEIQEEDVVIDETGIFESEIARDFTLKNDKGEDVSLSDYRGKKVLLNFFATWCPDCEEELPLMQKIHEEYKDKGLVILAVDGLDGEKIGKEEVKKYMLDKGCTFDITFDEDDKVFDNYQIREIPTNFIIDEEGIIEYRHAGGLDEETIRGKINIK